MAEHGESYDSARWLSFLLWAPDTVGSASSSAYIKP